MLTKKQKSGILVIILFMLIVSVLSYIFLRRSDSADSVISEQVYLPAEGKFADIAAIQAEGMRNSFGGPLTQNHLDYAWLNVSINNMYMEGCLNIKNNELRQKCFDGIEKLENWHG